MQKSGEALHKGELSNKMTTHRDKGEFAVDEKDSTGNLFDKASRAIKSQGHGSDSGGDMSVKGKMLRFVRGYWAIMLHGKMPDKVIAWLVPVAIAVSIVTCVLMFAPQFQPVDIHTNEFIEQLADGNLSEVHISPSDGSVSGKFVEQYEGKTDFTSSVQEESEYIEKLLIESSDVQYDFDKPSVVVGVISNVFLFVIQYTIIFGGLFFVLNSGSFGKQLEAMSEDEMDGDGDVPDTTFEDVVGIPEAIEEMQEIVTFLKDPEKYDTAGANFPHGILLQGPAGCGKTLLARALAGEAEVPFFAQSGSDFVEMFVGMGAKRVRKLFKNARKNKKAIIFIDEIDAIGSKRTSNVQTTSEEIQTINALLTEMDGFKRGNSTIVVIGATNRAEVLDPALTRPGRFDRIISVEQPAKEGRKEILQHYAVKRPFAKSVDFDRLAAHTYGFSGAQLENVMNQAATLAARRAAQSNEKPLITEADLDEGISRTISGPAMKSRQMSERERRFVAYHEAGHAIAQYLLPGCDNVQKISIVSRNMPGIGPAMGYVQSYSEEDSYVTTNEQCFDQLVSLLSGRASETMFCNVQSAGASDDLKKASTLAYKMANEFAFNHGGADKMVLPMPKAGGINIASDARLVGIEEKMQRYCDEAYDTAVSLLSENADKVRWVVATLMSEETIDSEGINRIMRSDTPEEFLLSGDSRDER